MKVLCIGDPHFKTTNVPEVDFFTERLYSLIEEEKPDLIIVLGDVLNDHERLHTIPLNKATAFFDRLRKYTETIVLVGNHDMTSNTNFMSENHWMTAYKFWDRITIVDKVIQKKFDDLIFIFSPYVPNGRFREALDQSGVDWKSADCIFAHQEFYGCKMGAIDSIDGDVWDNSFPYIISGHIHSRQVIQDNIYYSGSAMQNAFGESEKNTIPIFEFTNKKRELREIDLALPRKKIVYCDVDSIDLEKIEKACEKDNVKITISGDYEEIQAFKKTKKYKELKTKGKVVLKPKYVRIDAPKEIESSDVDFVAIFSKLIHSKKNPYLIKLYEKLINNKEVDESEILFV